MDGYIYTKDYCKLELDGRGLLNYARFEVSLIKSEVNSGDGTTDLSFLFSERDNPPLVPGTVPVPLPTAPTGVDSSPRNLYQ